MYKNISLEVIYLFILLENFTKNNSSKNLNLLLKFFSLSSMFDIKTYYILHSIFANSYDLNFLKTTLLDNNMTKSDKLLQIKKFREFLKKFIKKQVGEQNFNIMENKLNNIIDILSYKYSDNSLCIFLLKICKYLKQKRTSFISYIIYCTIEEYLDLFLDADKIIFNNKLINKHFSIYFDLLHLKPQNICFINKKNNIKIMQNFFPFDILSKIFHLIDSIEFEAPNKKYFLIEYDEKLVSTKSPELLFHEIGHLLNIKIYNFQTEILNLLYEKDKTINIMILNSWLNEIIADIIGNNIDNNFINVFNQLKENVECINYPPSDFRKAMLTNKKYDCSLFTNQEIRQIAMLIYDNLNIIKSQIKHKKS